MNLPSSKLSRLIVYFAVLVIDPAVVLPQSSLLEPAALAKAKIFTSLEEALRTPELVYRLNLSSDTTRTELPPEIGRLTNLQEFIFENNLLRELPAEIAHLRNLQTLNLSHLNWTNDAFTRLPKGMGDLKHLNNLNLIGLPNLDFRLTFFELKELPDFEILAIMNNRLTRLPDEVSQIQSLQQIWMGKNPNLDLKDTFLKLSKLTHFP